MSVQGNEDRERCPECDTPGEAIEENAGNLKWGCPRCENVWWGEA